jgi:putative membrane protein
MGRTAKRLGKSDAVKQYGQMLIKDHTDADKQLTALAKKHGQMIPMVKPATDTEKQEKADAKQASMRIKKLKGADFDQAFLAQMVTDHERELANIDSKASEVQDTELADTIRSLKPTLQMHADHARQLQTGTIQQTSMNTTTTPGTTTATGANGQTSGSTSKSTTTSTKTGTSNTGSTTTTKKTGTSN